MSARAGKRLLRLLTPACLAVAGVTALIAVLVWWWLVFHPMIVTAGMPVSMALPCLVRNSDVCSLAQVLCKQPHFFEVDRYFPAAFWTAFVLLSTAPLAGIARTSP